MLINFKSLAFILILLFIRPAHALDSLSVEVKHIKSKNWQLANISLSLQDIQKTSQQLILQIKQITLPEPFADLKLIDIQCSQFSWQENKINCSKGRAKLKSHLVYPDSFAFSFSLTERQSSFSIKNLKLANGRLSLKAREQGRHWSVAINTKNIKLKELHRYLSKQNRTLADIGNGQVNATIKASGNRYGLNAIFIKAMVKQLSLQANQGKTALESVDLKWDLQARLKQDEWQWHSSGTINQGELYQEPVYLKVKDRELTIKASGKRLKQGEIQLHQAEFNHPDAIALKVQGMIKFKPALNLESAHISTRINELDSFSTQYVLPFTEQTAFEGFKMQGKLNAEIDIKQSELTSLSADIQSLSVTDDNRRLVINKAEGTVNWSSDPAFKTASNIQWRQMKIRTIPIEAGQLKFLFKQKQLSLLEQSIVPMLDGNLAIKQFEWQHTAGEDEPKVYFEGRVNQLSLEKLTAALDWVPLSGTITGYIPGVKYENKTLAVKGELQVKLFDGTVTINKLSSSGLFTDFSKFSMSMEIENLDLFQITQKFKMGGMEGRISGYINNLYLENWHPITFYAWLGTPDNDESRHRISQKAVENIASIGGGGAADIISKGFLRFFDTFNYDRLGFGCYLHQGVCQLMGVEAAEQGYYLIKGGGIPRIDIMGYNTQVDWNVLMERLSRISSSDEVVIE